MAEAGTGGGGGKLLDMPLYIVESVGRDTRWSAAFLRVVVAFNVLSDMAFLALFLVIVLSIKMQLQFGILWICYTAIQGGLLIFYLIALLAYYVRACVCVSVLMGAHR
jgi:hypothetical protein